MTTKISTLPTPALLRTAILTAFLSFLGGSLILYVYYDWTGDPPVTIFIIGMIYILVALAVNLNVYSILKSRSAADQPNKTRILATRFLMLLNLPVCLGYVYFVLVLMNTIRVTFVNETPTTVSDIQVSGCAPDTKPINHIEPGQQATAWVGIPYDCVIYVEYTSNGQRKQETVIGYTTPSDGHKVIYRIGGNNKDCF
jgi:hypothetical protein